MRISSRTPEGTPNRCPLCGNDLRIEPSVPFGDAPCPRCGTLLWFVTKPPEGPLFFEFEASDKVREKVLEVLARNLGVSIDQLESDPSFVMENGLDSLDLVEIVMDVEDELNQGH